MFERDEHRELFGAGKRLVHVVEGLRPDEQLTDNTLQFDPAKMRDWIELGERKAQSMLSENPFEAEPADRSTESLVGSYTRNA